MTTIVLYLMTAAWWPRAGLAHSDQPEEVERLRTELRLRTGELAVARSQLAACWKRSSK